MATNPLNQNPNPNPNTTMAFTFMKALATIQKTTTYSSSFIRSRRISRAAYASMAVAAGPRRAWSNALIEKLRGRRFMRNRRLVMYRRAKVPRLFHVGQSKNRVQSLRRLVPGGVSMDLGGLLEETASYVECLREQVRIMQRIVDFAS